MTREEQIEALTDTLRFYADKENWKDWYCNDGTGKRVMERGVANDNGAAARAMLDKIFGVNCTCCRAVLVPAFQGADPTQQLKDALVVRFEGGYGMYIDPQEKEVKAILCSNCADQLREIDFINLLLSPHRD